MNIKSINFSNYKPQSITRKTEAQIPRVNDRISFTAKQRMVSTELMGKRYEVPEVAYNEVGNTQRFLYNGANSKIESNAVQIADNTFISTAHGIETSEDGILTNTDICRYQASSVEEIKIIPELDLTVIKSTSSLGSKAKIASKPPANGEQVYVIGYHPQTYKNVVIPAIYEGELDQNEIQRVTSHEPTGTQAEFYRLHSDVASGIKLSGLSGSRVIRVNEKNQAELVGIHSRSDSCKNTGIMTGDMYAVGLNTINSLPDVKAQRSILNRIFGS